MPTYPANHRADACGIVNLEISFHLPSRGGAAWAVGGGGRRIDALAVQGIVMPAVVELPANAFAYL
jgi:hypothetical protein